jgi:hypothetical protein
LNVIPRDAAGAAIEFGGILVRGYQQGIALIRYCVTSVAAQLGFVFLMHRSQADSLRNPSILSEAVTSIAECYDLVLTSLFHRNCLSVGQIGRARCRCC